MIATPVGRLELIVGKLVPYTLAGFLSVPLCLLVVVYGYDVPFQGNLGLFLLLAFVFLLSTMAIALFISAMVKTQPVAIMLSLLVFLFSGFFMSGLLIPFSLMGPLVKMEAFFFPTTHFVIISRNIIVKGTGFAAVAPYVAAVVIIGLLFTALTALTFKKKLRG